MVIIHKHHGISQTLNKEPSFYRNVYWSYFIHFMAG